MFVEEGNTMNKHEAAPKMVTDEMRQAFGQLALELDQEQGAFFDLELALTLDSLESAR